MSLPEDWLKKHAPNTLEEALPALVTAQNLTGTVVKRVTKIPVFKFGPDTLQRLPTDVSGIAPGAVTSDLALLGLNLLRHYVMTFDFSAGELILKPLGRVHEITRRSTAGLNLGFGEDQRVFVLSVLPNGPGDQAALRAGDELLAIEGLPLKSMKAAEFAAFKQLPPGTNVKVQYRRGDAEPVEVSLTLIAE